MAVYLDLLDMINTQLLWPAVKYDMLSLGLVLLNLGSIGFAIGL
jgi:hypothetical protein